MRHFSRLIGAVVLLLFVLLSIRLFEVESLLHEMQSLLRRPGLLMLLTAAYAVAFLLRAYAWRLYVDGKITIREGLAGLLYSLLVNHLSPLKIGDAVRIAAVTKRGQLSLTEATQSVVVLRLLDLLTLGVFGAIGTLLLFQRVSVRLLLFLFGMALLFLLIRMRHQAPRWIAAHLQQLGAALAGKRGIAIVLLVMTSWLFEAFVIFGISTDVSYWQAVWVNSITIAGQVFQLTPGGIGTYEAVMTFALTSIGASMQKAYEWALLSHGFKFVFSYAAGFIVCIVYPMQLTSYMRTRKGEGNGWKR